MNISNLQDLWNAYDSKLAETTKINKRILREILIKKPVKTINWLRIKTFFQLTATVLVIILFISKVKLRDSGIELYSGIILLSVIVLGSYLRTIQYYLMLKTLSFSSSALVLKEQIIHIKKHKLSTIKYGFLLTPLSVFALMLIIPIKLSQISFSIPALITVLVYVIACIYKWSSLNKEFFKINLELKKLEDLDE